MGRKKYCREIYTHTPKSLTPWQLGSISGLRTKKQNIEAENSRQCEFLKTIHREVSILNMLFDEGNINSSVLLNTSVVCPERY